MDAWHNVAGGRASWTIRTGRSDEGGEKSGRTWLAEQEDLTGCEMSSLNPGDSAGFSQTDARPPGYLRQSGAAE